MALWPRRSITGWAQCWPVRTAMPSRSSSVPMSCGWRLVHHERQDAALVARGADDFEPGHLLDGARGVGEKVRARERRSARGRGPGHSRSRRPSADGRLRSRACRPRTCRASSLNSVRSKLTERSCRRRPGKAASPSSSVCLAVERADAGRAVELVAGERPRNRSRAPGCRPPCAAPPGRRRSAPGCPGAWASSTISATGVDACRARSTPGSRPRAWCAATASLELVHDQLALVVDRARPTTRARALARAAARARCWHDAPSRRSRPRRPRRARGRT